MVRRHLALLLTAGLAPVACSDAPGNAGAACALNSDCPLSQRCIDGACATQCREDRDCEAAFVCVDLQCVRRADGETDTKNDAPNDTAPADSSQDTAPDTAPADSSQDAAADTLQVVDTSDADATTAGRGSLTGRVHFRLYDDSTLAVSRPIVYWTRWNEPPPPLPGGVSCDCGYPETAVVGSADGSFSLHDLPAGEVNLVVQKGQFRRVRRVTVTAETSTPAPAEATELPARTDAALGDTVPRVVIGTGRFDAVEDIFAKLRMGPITPLFGFDYARYLEDPSAWAVELRRYQEPRALDDDGDDTTTLSAPSFAKILSDADALHAAQLVMAPCASYLEYATLLTSPAVRENLRTFVNDGGKLYASDYAYMVVEQVFPAYIDFAAWNGTLDLAHNLQGQFSADGNADAHIGEPTFMSRAIDDTRRYDSDNLALDPNLREWMAAVEVSGDGHFTAIGNWVNLSGTGTDTQCCRDGVPVAVAADAVTTGPNYVERLLGDSGASHATWEAAEAEHANRPHTVRFPYGCGKVMYSTYHTVESAAETAVLQPQELVLLFMLLDINECSLDPVKE